MTSIIMRKMIDIGANLTDQMFRGIYNSKQKHRDDFDDVLIRAFKNGIQKIIVTGGSLTDSKAALEVANKHRDMFSTVGCHPTRCSEFEQHRMGPDGYYNDLLELIEQGVSKVVAIGELGLDYDRLQFCPKETQQKYFEMQLNLAETCKLPLFLHNRNSIDDFIIILNRNRDKFRACGGVVHSFDGTSEDLRQILDMGFYIGINGCSLKSDENLQVVKGIPSDRLMIETDCPWCEIKQTHAGYKFVNSSLQKSKDASNPNLAVKNRNEPMNLVQVLEVLASIREENIDELANQIYTNTNKLFFNV